MMEHGAIDDVGGGGGGDRRGGSGRGRGRGGWQVLPDQQMRRPLNPAVHQQPAAVAQMNEMFSHVTVSDVAKTSELSAEAAEFVPRSFIPPQANTQNPGWQRHSVQDRLNIGRNQQTMHHGQHQQHHHQQQQQQQQRHYYYGNPQQYPYHAQKQMQHPEHSTQPLPRYEGYSGYQGNMSSLNNRGEVDLPNLMTQLTTAMNTLSKKPDQFEDQVASLVCNITPHFKIQSNTVQIINAIIQKCIIDSNFRYSGARLCCHLDTAESSDNNVTFRTALFEHCKEKQENQVENWPKITEHTPEDETKCHGLIMTLAELVAQMDSTGPDSILGKLLLELISTVLKNPGPNSAKLICQSLKLSGQYLERDSSTNRQEIERVMQELTQLVTNGRVDVHVGRMVNNVCELRTLNWGRVVPSHSPTPVENSQSNLQNQAQNFDEPVFYGPDGQILSAEERRFCQDSDIPDDEYGDDITGPLDENEAEDDMIADAYEEFLKMKPNKNEGSSVYAAK